MNSLQQLITLALAIVVFIAVLVFLTMFVLIVRPWMRAVSNGVPLSFFTIVGMRLRGNPPTLLIDACVALRHDRVETSIVEVERTYIVNRDRVRTSRDLVGLVKSKQTGGKELRPA